MGIQGLLPLLKSIMVSIHVKDLEGCCVAVDTYSWLHKGALSCSKELCKGQPTTRFSSFNLRQLRWADPRLFRSTPYATIALSLVNDLSNDEGNLIRMGCGKERHIDYCMHRVNLLRHHGIKPILVFDGGLLPMKIEQEIKRSRARKENLERAIEHESNGNSAAAYECYQKAVDISPSVAYMLIQVLKQENVDYVVAPYEADAQMTFLALSRRVDAVITEDSDLIAFGCPRIIFKMDKFGQGVQYQHSMLQRNQELDFTGFTQQMVLEMCILSGCDYLQSLPGMGLKRAHALIRKFRSYEKVIKHLRYNTSSVPPLYEESFKKALLTFQYQRVYDTAAEDIAHLTEIPSDLGGDDLDFLGPLIPQDIVKGIAQGDLDPITKLPFKGENFSDGPLLHTTYRVKIFKSETTRNKLDLPAQKNTLTNYFCSASEEAKKAFRAPRVMPKNLDSTNESPISIDLVHEESPASSNALHGSVLNPGISSVSSLANFVGDGSISDSSLSSKSLIGYSGSSEHVACLKLSAQAVCKPCIAVHKSQDRELKFDAAQSKLRSTSRKVIVSSYFKPKSTTENNQQGTYEKFVSGRADDDNVDLENTVPKSNSVGSDDVQSYIKKRKLISTERTQDDTSEGKHKWASASLSNASDCANELESKNMETGTGDEKFGSSISHINYYSDVAEKSMERFLSAMTSFKYTSAAGSRASGLRAPLKDVRNTHWTRSTTIPPDVSKFSYLPSKNQKRASSATQRA